MSNSGNWPPWFPVRNISRPTGPGFSIMSHPDLSPADVFRLNGNRARAQYLAQGTQEALDLYVESYRQAVEATPDGDPMQLLTLNNFGLALRTRFLQLGTRADLDESIDVCQVVHALTPDDSPDKPPRMSNLAGSISDRFDLDGNPQDLEEAISLETHALNLAPEGDKSRPQSLNNLGVHLYKKFRLTGLSVDLSEAITLQRQAVDLTPENHPNKSSWLNNLSNLLNERYALEGGVEDLEQAITLQSHAIRLTPTHNVHWPGYRSNLGMQLLNRFLRLGDKEDIQRAVTSCESALEHTPDGHPGKPIFLNNLASALEKRYESQEDHQDLVQAVTCRTQAVELTPDSHYSKPMWLHNLGVTLTRLRQLGSANHLERAVTLQSQAVELLPDGHASKPSFLYNLASTLETRFQEADNITDLTMAIDYSKQSVELLPANHPSEALHLRLLGMLYETCSMSPHAQSEDLTNSLLSFSKAMQCIASPPVQRLRAAGQYANLVSIHPSLLQATAEFSLLQAFDLQLSLLPQCIWLGNNIRGRYTSEDLPAFGPIVSKATAAAIVAGDPVKALEWLESGRTLVQSQILQLYTPLDDLQRLHPQLASRLHHVAQALQHAATSSSPPLQLPATSPTTINHSIQTSLNIQAKSSHSYAVEYEKLITQVRKLEGFESFMKPKTLLQLAGACRSGPVVVINVDQSQCDSLVLYNTGKGEVQVEHIPLPSFSLDQATKLHKDLWSVLTARNLRGQSRNGSQEWNVGLDMDRGGYLPGKGMKHDPMFKILAALWTSVVNPIIAFINTLPTTNTNQLPHITWCPTGPLAFLPLHAAGIYHAKGAPTATIMDHAVSSYTPTLEALLKPQAQSNPGHQMPQVLVVAQPATPGCSPIPATSIEAAIVVSLTGEPTEVLEDTDGTVDRVLEAMTTHNWIHLACHGMQDRHNPINSSFALYDGKLTLETLMSKHLPNADLAVLSACQTATGDEKIVEEAVHLTAGMLNIGYKSVIGTMWSVFDDSAPVVMAQFYEVMMDQACAGGTLQPAYALHEATKKLREEYGVNDFVRWIPFVHFGL